ncbi:hypothetical protein MUY21_07160 [Aliiroseovarius sp. S2029]|uniref:hypothetical protein n=1 Tax=Aliiroseovarius sp. S2029 TaxID=2936988 RepID=UPI0020C148E0|nr:hypothetical protein [Aliiroseovarius sp. S2029]MCK8483809.1 hypothetical protein [Aliiroseovarius sp. S2029]
MTNQNRISSPSTNHADHPATEKPPERLQQMQGSYGRFLAMIVTSTVVMFGLMYLNTYAMDHVFFLQTRMWMALYMGGMMAIVMLAFMLGMYTNRIANIAVLSGR